MAERHSDIFVIGGGPSLRGFDFSKLHGRFKIGANGCARHADAQIMTSVDFNYIREYLELRPRYDGQCHFALPGGTKESEHPDVHFYTRKHCHGQWWQLEEGEIGGYCSGFAAFLLALRMRPERIHLLGIDMDAGGWFHNDYLYAKQRADNMLSWAKEFDVAAQDTGGAKVYNYSINSRVTAFEKRELCSL